MDMMNIDVVSASQLPLSERVLDRLADILFMSDEILDMLRMTERIPDDTTIEVKKSVQGVYDEVNELMKRLVD